MGILELLGLRRAEKSEPKATPAPKPVGTLLVPYSTDDGKRGPTWLQDNVDPILAIYFRPQPDHPAWKQITEENVSAYQLWFQRALLAAELHKLDAPEQLSGEKANAIADLAWKGKEVHGLNHLLILILAHQYIEADRMIRGMHTTDWTAFMMTGDSCAPDPVAIAQYVIEEYNMKRNPA